MITVQEALSIAKFSLDSQEYSGIVTKVYDGDSIHIVFEYKGEYHKWTCRLFGIDTAELRSKDAIEKAFAIETRDELSRKILYQNIDVKCHNFDKYGRLLVSIYKDNQNINQWLIDSGYAKRYFGGTKTKIL